MSEESSAISQLVQALDRLTLAIRSSQGRQSEVGSEWEQVSHAGASSVSEEDPFSLVAPGDYHAFEALRPECPRYCIESCRQLSAGRYSSEYRASRAWKAGYWAGLCLRGLVPTPRRSDPIDLKPVIYIVLKADGVVAPTRVSSSRDLFRIVGHPVASTAIFHSFPSRAEAQVYCSAAQVDFPPPHQWN